MRPTIGNIWRIIAAGTTVLAYKAFYDSLQDTNKQVEIDRLTRETNQTVAEIKAMVANCNDPALRESLIAKQNKLSEFLEQMKSAFKNASNLKPTDIDVESKFASYREDFTKAFDGANACFNDLVDIASEGTPKNMGYNSILDMAQSGIDNFSQFLSNLTTTELCLVINISTGLFILACFISILFALFGNFLLDKFSLDKRFPKISGIIKLRIKLQNYYIIFNAILILVSLILMIGVNFFTLIYV